MARKARGVASQIFLAGALVVGSTLTLVWWLTSLRAGRVAEAGLTQEINAARTAIDDALDRRREATQRAAATLASVPSYFSRFEGALERRDLSTLLDQAEEYRDQLGAAWVMLTDGRGTMAAWTLHPERTGEDFSGGALMSRALSGDSASGLWLEPMTDGTEAMFQAIAAPMRPPGAPTVSGVLIVGLPIDSALVYSLRRQTGSHMLLTTFDTSRVAHVVSTTIESESREALGVAVTARAPGAPIRVGDYLGAATPLVTAGDDTVGMLVGFRSRQQAMAAVDPLGTSTLLGFLVGLTMALGAGLVLARRIAAPIRTLVRATRAAREGNYSVTLPGHAPREISELARAFHGLLDELKAKEELVTVLQHERNTREMAVPAPGTIEVGSLFAGRYEIVHLLGTGGMGSVYRAIDRELGDTVALKALRTDLAEGSEALERFREEIRLARRISHRNVVRTHDLGLVGDVYYLTMELVDGRPLDDLLVQEGRLKSGAVHAIGVQMLRALEAAHEVGVVHRDIKPPNLLIDRAGLLKVTDFGIARLADETTRQKKLTQTGLIVGTPMYMAPEQLAGDAVDARADVYAAGAVLYECVTGASPHEGLTLPQLFLRAHQEAPPVDPRARAPDTPEALAQVIVRALMPKREKRWSSATAMIAALQGAE